MSDVCCFMIAARRDYARACVAAKSVRRRHPHWTLVFVSSDASVAPWRLGRGIFDTTVAAHSLPDVPADVALLDKALDPAGALAQAFHHLLAQGAQTAVYLNLEHVWFADVPIAEYDAGVESAKQPRQLSLAPLESVACLALAKKAGSQQRVATAMAAIHGEGVGVGPRDFRLRPLRFSTDGELFLGDERVKTICFGAPAPGPCEIVVDTTWLELQKWYSQELQRYKS